MTSIETQIKDDFFNNHLTLRMLKNKYHIGYDRLKIMLGTEKRKQKPRQLKQDLSLLSDAEKEYLNKLITYKMPRSAIAKLYNTNVYRVNKYATTLIGV